MALTLPPFCPRSFSGPVAFLEATNLLDVFTHIKQRWAASLFLRARPRLSNLGLSWGSLWENGHLEISTRGSGNQLLNGEIFYPLKEE
jgi:hypothetical protein